MSGSNEQFHTTHLALATLSGIRMNYGAGDVLKGIDAQIPTQKIISLLGLNGAGKSTLMHILAGLLQPSGGHYKIEGNVAMVSQELSLVPDLSIAENLTLPKLTQFRTLGAVSWKKIERHAERALKRVGLVLNVETPVAKLSSSEAQLVEIARALDQDAKLLILDEPTSALSKKETERLFKILKELTKTGTSILFVSHRLDEVLEISDEIWILKDGHLEAQVAKENANAEKIVEWMTGIAAEKKKHDARMAQPRTDLGPQTLLKIDFLEVQDPALGASDLGILFKTEKPFVVYPGTCVGLAGLLGSGRSVFLKSVASFLPLAMNKARIPLSDLKARGNISGAPIAFVHEDRKNFGLFKDLNALENISMGAKARRLRHQALDIFKQTGIRGKSDHLALHLRPTWSFSGGNQQKMLLGRALLSGAKLLLLDEPTRGVDAHARQEIFKLMRQFTRTGGSILWVSSDFDELVENSSEIFIISRGLLSPEPVTAKSGNALTSLVLASENKGGLS